VEIAVRSLFDTLAARQEDAGLFHRLSTAVKTAAASRATAVTTEPDDPRSSSSEPGGLSQLLEHFRDLHDDERVAELKKAGAGLPLAGLILLSDYVGDGHGHGLASTFGGENDGPYATQARAYVARGAMHVNFENQNDAAVVAKDGRRASPSFGCSKSSIEPVAETLFFLLWLRRGATGACSRRRLDSRLVDRGGGFSRRAHGAVRVEANVSDVIISSKSR
jgi:hypothetical protein